MTIISRIIEKNPYCVVGHPTVIGMLQNEPNYDRLSECGIRVHTHMIMSYPAGQPAYVLLPNGRLLEKLKPDEHYFLVSHPHENRNTIVSKKAIDNQFDEMIKHIT